MPATPDALRHAGPDESERAGHKKRPGEEIPRRAFAGAVIPAPNRHIGSAALTNDLLLTVDVHIRALTDLCLVVALNIA